MKSLFSVIAALLWASVSMAQSSTPQPQEHSNVVKEYDESGNITRYDSTYVRTWSSSDSVSSSDFEEMQQHMQDMLRDFNNNIRISGFVDSIKDQVNDFDFDAFSDDIQVEFNQLFPKDSVIFTYPLDSTMFEPINKYFSKEFMQQMQQGTQKQIDKFTDPAYYERTKKMLDEQMKNFMKQMEVEEK
ncbi:MAG: hypothetical protein ACK5JS_06005 [Mangrovibacterium sp.]